MIARTLPLILTLAACTNAAVYRADCGKPEWRDAARLNALALKPGDRLLLKSGCVWKGQLTVSASGAEGRPIVIDRYGEGARPRIDGEGKVVRLFVGGSPRFDVTLRQALRNVLNLPAEEKTN